MLNDAILLIALFASAFLLALAMGTAIPVLGAISLAGVYGFTVR